MARNSRDLAQRPAVDPHDEPSAEWGWHGSFPRTKLAAGTISILILVAFIFGSYQSRTQDLWLIGVALFIAYGMARQIMAKRNAWRR